MGAECLYTIARAGFGNCLRCHTPWFAPVEKSDMGRPAIIHQLREALVKFDGVRTMDEDEYLHENENSEAKYCIEA